MNNNRQEVVTKLYLKGKGLRENDAEDVFFIPKLYIGL